MADVIIISDTIQEFNGERFYLCGPYFQHKGVRLHRKVWEYHNGPILEGYHIHHIDGEKANNQLSNLALMPGLEHVKEHAGTEARRENGRRAIRIAIAVAPEWHRSEEGKAWHSEQGKKIWAKRQPVKYICTECGKEYESMQVRHTGNHFCHQNCRAKFGRRKRKGNED